LYNKRLATKTVADWELKVVVSRAEPVRIAFDWREYGMQTVDWGKQHLKNFLSMSSTIELISKHSLTKWYLYRYIL